MGKDKWRHASRVNTHGLCLPSLQDAAHAPLPGLHWCWKVGVGYPTIELNSMALRQYLGFSQICLPHEWTFPFCLLGVALLTRTGHCGSLGSHICLDVQLHTLLKHRATDTTVQSVWCPDLPRRAAAQRWNGRLCSRWELHFLNCIFEHHIRTMGPIAYFFPYPIPVVQEIKSSGRSWQPRVFILVLSSLLRMAVLIGELTSQWPLVEDYY